MKSKNKDVQFINDYLLGQGTEEERKSIEDRYFRDADFYEQILAQEDELIHDFLKGLLSSSQKALFENHFLHSERRRQKFLFVKSLINYADEHYMPLPAAATALAGSRLSRWVGELKAMFTPPMIAMSAAAVLTVTLSAVLVINKYRGDSKVQEILAVVQPAENTPSIAPAPTPPAQPAATTDAPASLDKKRAQTRKPQGFAGVIASMPAFVLNSASLRGADIANTAAEIYPIHFAADLPQIRLDVHLGETLGNSEHFVYEVIIKTLDGDEVFRQVNVKPTKTRSGAVIQFAIHTALLENGDYVLYINEPASIAEKKPVREMFFNVKRI
ncbi:MAG: hypothetical protein ACKVX9_16230 [Blastocatellia bacterium]